MEKNKMMSNHYLEYKHNGKSSRIVISEAEKSEIDAKVAEEKRKIFLRCPDALESRVKLQFSNFEE